MGGDWVTLTVILSQVLQDLQCQVRWYLDAKSKSLCATSWCWPWCHRETAQGQFHKVQLRSDKALDKGARIRLIARWVSNTTTSSWHYSPQADNTCLKLTLLASSWHYSPQARIAPILRWPCCWKHFTIFSWWQEVPLFKMWKNDVGHEDKEVKEIINSNSLWQQL